MKNVFIKKYFLIKTVMVATAIILVISAVLCLTSCDSYSHLTRVEGEVGKISPREMTDEELEIFNAMGAKGASASIHMTEGYLDIDFQMEEILPDGGRGETKDLERHYNQVEHSLDDEIVYFIQDTDERELKLSMGVSGEGLFRSDNIDGFIYKGDDWDDIIVEPLEAVLDAEKSSKVAKVTLKKDGNITRRFFILMKPVKPREWV